MKTACYCIGLLLLASGICAFCKKEPAAIPKHTLTLVFHHRAGEKTLVLGDSILLSSGEKITVDRFRYYVSNFSITDNKGGLYRLPAAYYLVDEADPLSKTIQFAVPDVPIAAVHFLLGVDSLRNVSGIQTGALDPMKGMFWTWNSGYIMAKLEGTCEGLATAAQRFTYHIGGFRFGMNAARNISVRLPEKETPATKIILTANIEKWFTGNRKIRIAETPVCHSPGPLAVTFANNYSHMFSFNSIR